VCEVILNLHVKHLTRLCQTTSFWTGPCRVKGWPALPKHHVWTNM